MVLVNERDAFGRILLSAQKVMHVVLERDTIIVPDLLQIVMTGGLHPCFIDSDSGWHHMMQKLKKN
jgi:hypothetical protein